MGNALYDFYSLDNTYQKTHSFAALTHFFSDTNTDTTTTTTTTTTSKVFIHQKIKIHIFYK